LLFFFCPQRRYISNIRNFERDFHKLKKKKIIKIKNIYWKLHKKKKKKKKKNNNNKKNGGTKIKEGLSDCKNLDLKF
jgi:hypothetical protein